MNYHNYPIAAKSTTPSTGNAWASVAAAAGVAYQLVHVAGNGSAHAATVSVLFGTTEKLRYISVASGNGVTEMFGLDGPITATNEALVIHTTSQPGGAGCSANMLYRIVKI